MNTHVFKEWLGGKRVMAPLPGGKQKMLFVDIGPGHRETTVAPEVLQRSCTKLAILPKNATDLCQPADYFILQKIRTVWRCWW